MANCFLITMGYPYGNGESFLENEVPYLSKYFEKVYVFSYNGKAGEEKREVPSNFSVFPLGMKKSSLRYLLYSIKGVVSKDNDLIIDGETVRRRVSQYYYRGRGLSAINKVADIITNNELVTKKATFYSYWFTDLAYVAWKLSETYSPNDGCICVSRAHGYDVYWERNRFKYLPFQELSARKLNSVYVCSQNGKNYLQGLYPFVAGKIKTEYLGTADIGLAPYDDETICFATCSQLIDVKRVMLFAKAFLLVKRIYPLATWICIGDGPQMNEIKKTVKSVIDSVTFYGAIKNKSVFDIYRSNSITYFCNVSSSEGIPVSIMEAISMGIPCIATDVGGTSELVDEKCGLLLPKDLTADSLAGYLNEALTISKSKYFAKRESARKKWSTSFQDRVNYSRWGDIIGTNAEL